jgi:hypothetical protein
MLFDSLEEDRILSQEERQLREQSYERLALELKQRAAYWKQRAKFRAVREGDSNTAFFHAHATTRMRRNNIKSIAVNGVQVTNHSVKVHALTEHFKGIIGVPGQSEWHFNCEQLYQDLPQARNDLTVLFTEQEAVAALKCMIGVVRRDLMVSAQVSTQQPGRQ